jgi:uncharacterized protein YdeI (YjbR/CyaY-like superfamily)
MPARSRRNASRRPSPPAEPPNSVHPKSRAGWKKWLAQNHTRTDGVWLISFKKGTGKPRMEYDEAVEEALRFGWIDSKPRSLDGERSMLWFAPRRPGTGWSKANRERVERLIAEGSMAPAGLIKVNAAKKDGSWLALVDVESLTLPPDLKKAFAHHPGSEQHFNDFPRSVKRSILEWIQNAKKPETRAKRINETAQLAARNVRANQWRQPASRKYA